MNRRSQGMDMMGECMKKMLMRFAMVALVVLTFIIISSPQPVEAKLQQGGSCIDCHNAQNTNVAIEAALNGSPIAFSPVGAQNWTYEAALTIPASTPFEIDMITDIVRAPTSGQTMDFEIIIPQLWLDNTGTAPANGVTRGTDPTFPTWTWNATNVWDGDHAQMPPWTFMDVGSTQGQRANPGGGLRLDRLARDGARRSPPSGSSSPGAPGARR